MDFRESPVDRAFRDDVRAFLAEHVTPELVARTRRTGTLHDAAFAAALAERGWLTSAWPTEFGGRDVAPPNLAILYEEAALAAAPMNGVLGTHLVAETIREWGSDYLRATVLPAAARGQIVISLGFTEPDNGSDVAAATTRATRLTGGWVVSGQKMFTTLAEVADYILLLARTDPAAPKHRGLTLFLVPATATGVEIRQLETLGGETANVTYYTDVEIGDDWVVGEVNRGWDALTVALSFERGAQGSIPAETRRVLQAFVSWAGARRERGLSSPLDSPAATARLVSATIEVEVARLLCERAISLTRAGRPPVIEGSMAKLFASETYQRVCRSLMEISGTEGVLRHGEPEAVADGVLEHAFRHSVMESIAGGTSEIQREIIARRGLRLPSPPRA